MNKQLAAKLFLQGYSCSQAVASAFADECGVSVEFMQKAAIAFGGGFVKTHTLCGALSGAALVAGMLTGQTDADAKNRFAAEFKSVIKEFIDKHGSMTCADMINDKDMLLATADFTYATKEQYEARPCLSLVLSACDLTEKFVSRLKNNN